MALLYCVNCISPSKLMNMIHYTVHTNAMQVQAVMQHFSSTRHVTRFTKKKKFVGLQQSTDVCLTTQLWPSLIATFVEVFPALCCQTVHGSD